MTSDPVEVALLESVYRSLGVLSRGLELRLRSAQELTGSLREADNAPANALADVFAKFGEGVGGDIGFVAEIRDRIAAFAPRVLDDLPTLAEPTPGC